MTSLATTAAASTKAGPRRLDAALDRAVGAFPLLAGYLLLAAFYAWHAQGHASPWLFGDEVEYAQLSRSLAETGEAARRGTPHDWISLYTYLLAPVWRLADDVPTAYAAIKYLGAFTMTAAVFPAYWLARLVVPRGPALLAAIATGALPALAYSRLLVIEVLAYPFAALAFFLIAKALATWSSRWLAAAILAVLVAPAVRGQLTILQPVLVGSLLVALWFTPPARRFRAGWGVREWLGVAIFAGLALHVAHRVLIRWELYYLATTLPDRAETFFVSATAAFAIGVGVVPVVAALTALWRPRDVHRPEYVALAGLLATSVVGFTLYTTLKTVYLSTVFGNVVAERNLIYLAPLVFAAAALAAHRPTASPLALGAATGAVVLLVANGSYQLAYYPYFDAPGLSVLAHLNRTWGMDEAAIRTLLVSIAALSGVLLLAAAHVRRWRPVRTGVLTLVGAAVVAWCVTGNAAFANGINHLSNRVAAAIPTPHDWIDRATGGARTAYLGFGITDANAILATEFWNRSVVAVGSLDGTAPGPGPTFTPLPYRGDGAVLNDPGVEYVVTDAAAVEVEGELVERTGDWRLLRIDGPLRLRSSLRGVYADGWSGPAASYSRFGRGERGTLEVVLSRTGWTGVDKPGRVEVAIGRLVPQDAETIANPCRPDGTCVSPQPELGEILARRSWIAHAGQRLRFRIAVTTPFQVEVGVDPTFSTTEFGGSDPRQLGVQVGFSFTPSR